MTDTPLSLLQSTLGPDEVLRSVVVQARDGDEIRGLALREQPARSGDGTVLNIRTWSVYAHQRKVSWHDNGMFLETGGKMVPGFMKALAAVRDEQEAIAFNGLAGGDDTLGRHIMREELEPREPAEPAPPEGEVRCERCEQTGPVEEMDQFSSGPPLGDMWVHSNGCPDPEDA